MLGYLIGDGYVGGKTPLQFINVQESLKSDASRIAAAHGCETHARADKLAISFSHRPGEKNELLALCRRARIYGKLAWEKTIPAEFFTSDVSSEVVGNLLFGLLETDGYVSAEQTGAIRVGFTTTSEQLAHQIHWLLLRFGIARRCASTTRGTSGRASSAAERSYSSGSGYETRITGSENVEAFAAAIPLWGPRGEALGRALARPMAGVVARRRCTSRSRCTPRCSRT